MQEIHFSFVFTELAKCIFNGKMTLPRFLGGTVYLRKPIREAGTNRENCIQ